MNSLWNDAMNWACQHPVDDVLLSFSAVVGITLGAMAYKQNRADHREMKEVEKTVDNFCNRPKKKVIFPPHAPRS